MSCRCLLENISNLMTKGITNLVEHGYLLALWLGKLEIQLLPPTQAVNSCSKAICLKTNFFLFLLFAFDMRDFMLCSA